MMRSTLFEDRSSFEPDHHSKVPLKSTWPWLALRGLALTFDLVFSAHPGDYYRWVKSMLLRRSPMRYPLPWITFAAAREISRRLGPDSTMFEFGAGNSTLYWARRITHVTAVEHDAQWFALVGRLASARGLDNIDLVHAADQAAYIGALDRLRGREFDAVVVDGAYRRECVLAAIGHVKKGGMLIVDNTDWHWFQEDPLRGIPDDWSRLPFGGYAPMMGYPSETTVYVRPT
jgi:hypothetical protein